MFNHTNFQILNFRIIFLETKVEIKCLKLTRQKVYSIVVYATI